MAPLASRSHASGISPVLVALFLTIAGLGLVLLIASN